MLFADQDYVKTLGLEIVAGRDFARNSLVDESQAFVISETAAKLFGYTNVEDALEHQLDWNVSGADTLKTGKVIGVVRDIQLNSMRENVTPIVLNPFKPIYSNIVLRIKPKDIQGTIAHLEKTWTALTSQWPFEYRFLDENFDRMYKSEQKLTTLFIFFTIFTISIACVGLFGLVVYSTSQMYKEISIRKVLGASEGSLVMSLVRSYIFLLIIACTIAVPLSYYAISRWLESFTFRIPITQAIFLEAGMLIIVISMITVGLQSLKAARANPVNSLRSE
jgi:putative ABC transport system permease protein